MEDPTHERQSLIAEGLVLPVPVSTSERACRAILRCLEQDCRMSLVEMSRRTGYPTSTLYDNLRRLRASYDFGLILRPKRSGNLSQTSFRNS